MSLRVIGLISGGKDSCYNLMKCVENGHQLVGLINLYPADENRDELDSYMYQTVGHQLIQYYSEALQLPLFRKAIKGKPLNVELDYDENKINQILNKKTDQYDEVEDLFDILKEVKDKVEFDAVSVGAIFSSYQNNRVLNVCNRLNLKVLAYLWQKDQKELLNNMINDGLGGLEAILIKVAAIGLIPESHLGKNLKEMQSKLIELETKYGINVCGEGGEYETFTLNCPLFKKRIEIEDTEVIIHSDDAFAKVGFLRINKLKLVNKN